MKKKNIKKQLFLLIGIIIYLIFWDFDIIRGKTKVLVIIPIILFVGILLPFFKDLRIKRKEFILRCDRCSSIIEKENSMFLIDGYLFCTKCSASYLSRNKTEYEYLSYKKAKKRKKRNAKK